MLELEAELLSWRRKAEVDLRNEASRLFQHALILRQENHFKNVSLNFAGEQHEPAIGSSARSKRRVES